MAIKHFKTISDFYQFRDVAPPQHPLIGVINVDKLTHLSPDEPMGLVFDFFTIAIKRTSNLNMQYGQQAFDFNNGIMSFMAPNQVISISIPNGGDTIKQSGWLIHIHPDFLWNTALAKTIRSYDFWDYSLHESLFLSEKEETVVDTIVNNIQQEYKSNIDKFSKKIIVSHIESLLNYADRFYHRQFITREKANHDLLERLEALLTNYFNNAEMLSKGLPSVSFVAKSMNVSPKYLTSMLKILTGLNTQQHIHEKLIEKAKEKLSTTQLSISEISYELGFEHLQSFSKLFKMKTSQSPVEFRASFN